MVACLFIHGYLPPLLVRQRSNVPLQWPLSRCGYLADKSEQLHPLLLVAIKLLLAFLPCHIWYRSNRKLNLENELVFLLDFYKLGFFLFCLFVFVRHLFVRQYGFVCPKPIFPHAPIIFSVLFSRSGASSGPHVTCYRKKKLTHVICLNIRGLNDLN